MQKEKVMGKIIGLDYGSKRVGIAITDELCMIASPMETVHSKDLLTFLKEINAKDSIDAVVLGLPKGLRGEDTDSTQQVLELKIHLERQFPNWEIHLIDERFTSKMAVNAMVAGNLPKAKRREKGMVDKISAAIILQSFLETK